MSSNHRAETFTQIFQSGTDTQAVITTNGEWKTIYFDISSIIYSYNYTGASVTTANIVLSGNNNPSLSSTHFEIDNIKVIYQPAS